MNTVDRDLETARARKQTMLRRRQTIGQALVRLPPSDRWERLADLHDRCIDEIDRMDMMIDFWVREPQEDGA